MNDSEYAVCIYCLVFNVDADDGDAYVRGILDAVKSLEKREQAALESYFRYNKTFDQTGTDLGGVSAGTASRIVNKALRKLRHPSRSKNMSVSRISKQKDRFLEDETAKISEKQEQMERILQGDPETIRDVQKTQETWINEMNFLSRTQNQLIRSGFNTIESILILDKRDDIQNIHGLGKKSQEDLIEKMRSKGYVEWANRMETIECKNKMNFSSRTANLLHEAGKDTEETLLKIETLDELMQLPGFGKKTCDEIIIKMLELGHTEWVGRMKGSASNDANGLYT